MRRIDFTNRREWLTLALPALLLVVAAFAVAWKFVQPAPPRQIVMSTGPAGGAYQYFAERYRERLARDGIELVLRPSTGAVENLNRLKTVDEVDMGFVQGGVADEPESDDLATLGSMYLEPVWVFFRGKADLDRIDQLKGRRIAVGAPGSGTLLFALQLLSANGFATDDPHFIHLGGLEAVEAIRSGQVDAVFAVGAPQAPAIQALLAEPGLSLLNFAQADGYVRHFPHLTRITLPRGAIDIAQDRPPRDIHLLAATANLVVMADLHPAIVTRVLQHAAQIHGQPGMFMTPFAFPANQDRSLPLHPSARRFYESGPPFLQRYLPFWLAVLIDRLIVMLVPIVAVVIPLFKVLPALYNWRMRSRVYRWYGELKFLENEIGQQSTHTPEVLDDFIRRLDGIEDRASRRKLPLAFSNELYTLREHINLVRQRLERLQARAQVPAAPTVS